MFQEMVLQERDDRVREETMGKTIRCIAAAGVSPSLLASALNLSIDDIKRILVGNP